MKANPDCKEYKSGLFSGVTLAKNMKTSAFSTVYEAAEFCKTIAKQHFDVGMTDRAQFYLGKTAGVLHAKQKADAKG